MDRLRTLGLVVGEGEFIALRPQLVRDLGGEPDVAMVLTLIKWKLDPQYRHVYQQDGHDWWTATVDELCERTGLTVARVRRALRTLLELGLVIGEKHRRKGAYDHALSYRLVTAADVDAPESLENTDLSASTNRSVGDDNSIRRPQQTDLSPAANLLSVKTPLNSLNADAVGGDEEVKPNVGLFIVTPKRLKLITDAMVDSGQAHAVPAYVDYLRTVDRETGELAIKTWCGIQAATRNGEKNRRDDVNALLTAAGLAPVSEEEWQAMLDEHPLPRPDCRMLESGYCDRHGLRADDPGHSPRTVSP